MCARDTKKALQPVKMAYTTGIVLPDHVVYFFISSGCVVITAPLIPSANVRAAPYTCRVVSSTYYVLISLISEVTYGHRRLREIILFLGFQ